MELKAARAQDPVRTSAIEEQTIKQFQQFDLSLKSYEVKIPFADKVMLANDDTTARGHYELVLQHTKISAVINQHKDDRLKDHDGTLVATVEDYEAAYLLVSAGAYQVFNPVSKGPSDAYQKAKVEWTDRAFRECEMIRFLGNPQSTVQGWIKLWLKNGMAENVGLGDNKAYRLLEWTPCDKTLGLVSPADLRKKLLGQYEEAPESKENTDESEMFQSAANLLLN